MAGAEMNIHVVVAGSIGVGKSTFIQAFSGVTGFSTVFEDVGGNPYLPLFYSDMRTWAYKSQLHFLRTMFDRTLAAQRAGVSFVQERSIYEVVDVFGTLLHDSELIADKDWQHLLDSYEQLSGAISRPTTIVYLQASPPTCLRRIVHRNREFEHEIGIRYLEALERQYTTWIQSVKARQLILLNTENMAIEMMNSVALLIKDQILETHAAENTSSK